MEGCTAPGSRRKPRCAARWWNWSRLKGAKIQYVTVQNWSANVLFNLVTSERHRPPEEAGAEVDRLQHRLAV